MVFGFTGLWINIGVFLVAAAVIGYVGPRLSRAADRVGSMTGLGQTVAGALLLGASTSLPGLVVSLQTAFEGRANLAVANSLGGIAAQTLFIAFADVALRSDTLQHRDTLAASLMQSAVLVSLLTLLLMGMLKPEFALYGAFHPLSLAVIAGVILGFWVIQETRKHPSWRAREADDGGRGSGGKQRSDGQSGSDGTGNSQSANTSGSDAGENKQGHSAGSGGNEHSARSEGSDDESNDPTQTAVETRVVTVTDRILSVPFRERVYTERTVESRNDDTESRTRHGPEGESNGKSGGDSSREGSESRRESDGQAKFGQRSNSGRQSTSNGEDGQSTSNGEDDESTSKEEAYRRYAIYVVIVGISGFLISSTAGTIISQTGLSSVVMGLTLTAVATSLPELVTAVASVRRGAVGLAIGDIVGGNAFDTIMVALADFAYAEGSIYRAATENIPFIASVALLMTGVLAVGLVRRDQEGLANIGIESYLLIIMYFVGIAVVLFGTAIPIPW